MVCALRRTTNFALDDLTFVVCHFLPHLNRDSIWRILKAEGLNRRPKPVSERPTKPRHLQRLDLGFIHIEIKHCPSWQTAKANVASGFSMSHRSLLTLRPPCRQGQEPTERHLLLREAAAPSRSA